MQREQSLAGRLPIRIRLHSEHISAAVIPPAILANTVHQELPPDLNPFLEATRHLIAQRLLEGQDADCAGRDPGSGARKKGPAFVLPDNASALAQQLVP